MRQNCVIKSDCVVVKDRQDDFMKQGCGTSIVMQGLVGTT